MDLITAQQLSTIFKAVAEPTRQRILHMLHEQDELSVGTIAQALDISQPATSQHLRVLKEAGVVRARKSGQQMNYSLCSKKLYAAVKNVVKVYRKEVAL